MHPCSIDLYSHEVGCLFVIWLFYTIQQVHAISARALKFVVVVVFVVFVLYLRRVFFSFSVILNMPPTTFMCRIFQSDGF